MCKIKARNRQELRKYIVGVLEKKIQPDTPYAHSPRYSEEPGDALAREYYDLADKSQFNAAVNDILDDFIEQINELKLADRLTYESTLWHELLFFCECQKVPVESEKLLLLFEMCHEKKNTGKCGDVAYLALGSLAGNKDFIKRYTEFWMELLDDPRFASFSFNAFRRVSWNHTVIALPIFLIRSKLKLKDIELNLYLAISYAKKDEFDFILALQNVLGDEKINKSIKRMIKRLIHKEKQP